VVLRILRPDAVRIGLVEPGFEPDNLEIFNKIIRRPNGIFLVTGPTGSGKTTTLYSALDVLNRPDKKIITAEDPVEYNFEGINQCQVRDGIGLTFPAILRSMLRQAPNIILVGEIRDREVGEIAIQAALTGHLVFSTLHTNDAPSAMTRLIDMGIKPFLVASFDPGDHGPAADPDALHAEQGLATEDELDPKHLSLIGLTEGRGARARCTSRCRRRGAGRVQGPEGHLRDDADERGDPRPGVQDGAGRRDARRPRSRGHASARGGRQDQGAQRRDDARGDRPREPGRGGTDMPTGRWPTPIEPPRSQRRGSRCPRSRSTDCSTPWSSSGRATST
jgi:energy-coupling factor transporter ATP-binding protein EcfA2